MCGWLCVRSMPKKVWRFVFTWEQSSFVHFWPHLDLQKSPKSFAIISYFTHQEDVKQYSRRSGCMSKGTHPHITSDDVITVKIKQIYVKFKISKYRNKLIVAHQLDTINFRIISHISYVFAWIKHCNWLLHEYWSPWTFLACMCITNWTLHACSQPPLTSKHVRTLLILLSSSSSLWAFSWFPQYSS